MFRGRYDHAIDGKGRTSLPSRFRDALAAHHESCLVLTTGLESCVVAYPLSEWVAFEERLARLPQFDRNVAMIRRIYVSSAVECEIDKLGRILIPSTLREHAHLEREVIWAGMGRQAELWSKLRFDELKNNFLDNEEERTSMAKRLAELGL